MNNFSALCNSLRSASGHREKSKIVSEFIRTSDGKSLDEVYVLFRFLLPKETKQVYNIKDKQLINLFSQIFDTDKDDMLGDLDSAEDAATTIGKFFKQSDAVRPSTKSTLTLEEVDHFLGQLANTSKEADRLRLLTSITKKCTVIDLITVVRLIRQDLRINAGSKQIMDGLHPQAYAAFQASRDLKSVIRKALNQSDVISGDDCPKIGKKPALSRVLSVSIHLMTPIKPMLAEPCRSAAQAIAKASSSGKLLAEVKYDGERLQVHKDGDKFSFYSRSLKPAAANKVSFVEPYVSQAFGNAKQLVLDCEMLLLDTKTNKPLPFGTLGVHKRTAFKDANVCVFVFDCLFVNGETLVGKPISYRRSVLEKNFSGVKHRVLLSEKHIIQTVDELNKLMARVFSEGLEGLVLKPFDSTYDPGKRHWLKVKRDYLAEGSMADSVDLIVLGAYYGTGSKAGIMSVFLMGCYDQSSKSFATVTKCGNGFTDEMLQDLQKTLKVDKVSKGIVPTWLNVAKPLVPDFVVSDPKKAPIWEITGAEFSRATTHTAGARGGETQGISIRFPRFTKERPDKSWREATNVEELEKLVGKSGQRSDWLDVLNEASSCTSKSVQKTAKRLAPAQPESKEPTYAKSPKKPRHLKSLFEGVVIQISDDLDKAPELHNALRQLIACGAQLYGSVGTEYALFATTSSPTHLLTSSESEKFV
ncbi:unnamed protein product [Calicophoron daubneyi]|uniref:DNA ligase 3 n=1 Tax=Calicophoron daubneyi TaxID=300641 RepID=A0AAV2TBM7_CALDB